MAFTIVYVDGEYRASEVFSQRPERREHKGVWWVPSSEDISKYAVIDHEWKHVYVRE